jgi:hypothetical protein
VRLINRDGHIVLVRGGCVLVLVESGAVSNPDVPQVLAWRGRSELLLWYHQGGVAGKGWAWVPLWMPAAPVLAWSGGLWWRDVLARRRRPVGLCERCGYDRKGIGEGSVCPECGAA